MYRILFVSRFNQESLQIKKALAQHASFQVDWVRSAQQAIQSLTENKPDIAIINVDHFNQSKQNLAIQLRQLGCQFPILFLANSGTRLFRRVHIKMGVVGILTKPCTEKELVGVIEKLREGKAVSQRAYRRFMTNQTTKIEFWNTGHKFDGQIVNLSLGGAQLAVRQTNLRTGDVLKLNVELSDLDKHHEVNAKVVWDTFDPITEVNQVGIQFVKTVDIYQSLLNRI